MYGGDRAPDGSQCNYADKNADATLRQIDESYNWADLKIDDGYARCAPVGSFPPNGYGLYDMAGNVYEWCQDWYNEDYYNNSPTKNPSGPGTGSKRVLRGGGWDDGTTYLRVASRYSSGPANRHGNHGFRCVSGSDYP